MIKLKMKTVSGQPVTFSGETNEEVAGTMATWKEKHPGEELLPADS